MSTSRSRRLRRTLRGVKDFFSNNALDPLPIRGPARRYNLEKFQADARAGLNVALLALPQGMAYAAIAGLPIVYGIACSAVAAIVAPFFSGSRHTILGPTNATSFMVFSFIANEKLAHSEVILLMPLLCLMVGLFCVLGALLKVADLLQYVSRSVLVGYIAGAAVLIIANQLKHIFGTAALVEGEPAGSFVNIASGVIRHVPDISWQPLLLGVATLLTYLFLQRRYRLLPIFAISLIAFSLLNWLLASTKILGFDQVDTFDRVVLAELQPDLSIFSNYNELFHNIGILTAVAFAIAFLASLENTVMSKSLASRTGDRPDINQDMLAVGMANLASALFARMPASGSLTRSALNYDSGARTRFASLICGILCLLGLLLLIGVPVVQHIPKACLAALVIAIAISLISPPIIRICLRSTPDDAAVLVVTFLAALMAPLHVAIFIGVALSITLFLRKASRPFLVEYEISDEGDLRELGEKRKRPNPAISIVHVEGDLFFGAAELFRTQIQRAVVDENLKVIILRLKNARHLDATSVMALEDLIRFTRKEGRHIIVSGATREVYRVLKASGVLDTLQEGTDREAGESNIFLYRPSNPNISTRDALKRAQQLLGTTKADIKIFYDPSKEN